MLAGSMAYADAVKELEYQCRLYRWKPDCIVLASGTGTTQAGLLGGLDVVEWDTHVIGISSARKNPRGRLIVEQAYDELRQHLGASGQARAVDFRDEWVGDGYERPTEGTIEAIRLAAKLEGLILDPTYTGKAFSALIDMIHSGEIDKGSRIVFWHTGGLLNLTASNVFSKGVLKS
jgi:1-aminocyclopropane-1-carboxylate deaminase/D-cysteine desulfhydrase-like pyridoxal-dependent ACC family enzyme